jgi:hypothetical protein
MRSDFKSKSANALNPPKTINQFPLCWSVIGTMGSCSAETFQVGTESCGDNLWMLLYNCVSTQSSQQHKDKLLHQIFTGWP